MNIHQKINVRSYFNPVDDNLNDCRANRPRLHISEDRQYQKHQPAWVENLYMFKGWKKYELRNIKK